jgi:hypothetical protein
MSRRIRRSVAAAVRVSLISFGGALGLLALSSGAASADDGEPAPGLAGSVVSVVESVGTPLESVVQEISAPLSSATNAVAPASSSQRMTDAPAVSEIVSDVPDAIGGISVVDAVAPVTTVVDSVVAQVPVANAVVPQGTTTAVTQPVLESVDFVAAPVLPPAEQVVAPVVEVLVPVAETVDPVVEVVEPIVKPVIDPVVDVVEPVVKPAVPVVTLPEPVDVVEAVPAPAPAEPSDADPQLSENEEVAPASATPVRPSVDAPSSTQSVLLPQALFAAEVAEESAAGAGGGSSAQGAVHVLQGVPDLASADLQHPAGSLRATAGSATAGATGAGSTGSGTPYAAEARFSFDFDLSSTGPSQPDYAAALPTGPTFNPGSTPD